MRRTDAGGARLVRPLEGIRVLDFTRVFAGPLCTQYLGDLGAEIIKVEPIGSGDETRGWPPFPQPGLGTAFLSLNRNKRSISLDLKTDAGQEIAHRLAKNADVAIENFSVGVAERIGIGPETLQALNPRLVYCSISGFGRAGPLSHAPGYDVVLQAFSGIMALTGDDDHRHIRSPISPIDQMAGMHALTGILALLMERQRTQKGGTVRTSLFETAVGLLGHHLQTFWETGTDPERRGSGHDSLSPYGAFETADGAIMIAVANDRLWQKLCIILGMENLIDDPRFTTNADRVKNRRETHHLVQATLCRRPTVEWHDLLLKAGVPSSPINRLSQMIEHPHTIASDIVLNYEHPTAGALKAVAHPILFNDEAHISGSPPPTLGQHTDEVLAEIGYTPVEIVKLKSLRIVA